jgi:hypothetical protein
MFQFRHSLFIPPIRAWLIRQLGVDWPARRHLYLRYSYREPDRAYQTKICIGVRRPDLHRPCITAALRPGGYSRGGKETLCAHRQDFSSARHRQSGCGEHQGKRPRRAGLFQKMRRERRQGRGRRPPRVGMRTRAFRSTGSGSGARSPRRWLGRCLAFHKVAKKARQPGPIRKCRVRGILET